MSQLIAVDRGTVSRARSWREFLRACFAAPSPRPTHRPSRLATRVAAAGALSYVACLALVWALSTTAPAQDVQVNSADNNASNLDNETTESETSVARNGSLVVIGYNTSRQAGELGAGSFTSLSGYAYSTNGGATFTDGGFVPAGSYQLDGDPALAFDSSGNLYYASLLENPTNFNSYIGVNQSTSTSPSVVFGNPVLLSGPNSTTGGFEDKEFIAVDKTGGTYNGRVYVAWSDFPASGNPQAMFAASSSTSPLAFSSSIELAPSSSSFQHGAFPLVGPDGSVYVAWSTLSSLSTPASATINLVKSTNGGASFANPDSSDPNPTKTVASFTSTIEDISTGTTMVGQSIVNPLRTRSFPFLAADYTPAGSPTRGNLYCVFEAQPGSTSPPRSEVFFTASTDGGKTWSAARNITSGLAATLGADPTNNDNWLPYITVSPVTGHIKILLYSRREDPGNQKIRVYEAGSTDGGLTFYNSSYSAVNFVPSVGYDPLLVPSYMGDYLFGFADANGLVGAWGDTRNDCTPPGGASSPCSPSGRGDQDVFAHSEADATGVDLAITPWGAVTGVGPLWQSPDIFVVNSANMEVNASLGIVNKLQARIRNLGNADATGAVVRFRFAPWYASIPDSAFELIGTVTVNVPAGGAPQIVPIDWSLVHLTDTNGGIWPGPISSFSHFCVRVDIEYPSDINLSNNAAQTNFFDVTVSKTPLGPIHFLIGNPYEREVTAEIVTSKLPPELKTVVRPPTIQLARPVARARTEARAPAAEEVAAPRLTLKPHELQIGTITLAKPPASVTAHLTHDLVVDVSTVIDGRPVSGFSVLLARANAAPAKPSPGPVKVVSKVIEEAVPPQEPVNPQKFEMTAPVERAQAVNTIAEYLASQKVKVTQRNAETGVVSAGAIPLNHEELLAAVPEQVRAKLPANAQGVYYVTFKATQSESGERQSNVTVSTRILVDFPRGADSPLRGRVVQSNGHLEQTYLSALTTRLNAR